MFVPILVIIICFIVVVFYFLIRRYYIVEQFMLEEIENDNNLIKIRGDYITISDDKKSVFIENVKNKWYYSVNGEKKCELKPNESIKIGNKEFKMVVRKKNGGFFILLPLFITFITILLLFSQGYSIIISNKDDKENDKLNNITQDEREDDKSKNIGNDDEKEIIEKDIHTIVLENDNLFQENRMIDWSDIQFDREKKHVLKKKSLELGITVSEHQQNINWEKIKKGKVDYALIRIGRRGYENGELKKDAKFKRNLKGAKKNNIKVGGFFYSQAINQKEVDQEIELIFQTVEKDDLDYPIGISLERRKKNRTFKLSNEEYIDIIKYFCIKMRQNGYTPMIMEKEKWFSQFAEGTFDGYLKLVSNEKSVPSNIKNCIIWEYNEEASKVIDGIDSEIELSVSAYNCEKGGENK